MTPLQELIKLESDLTRMFDSDHRVAMAILDYIRNNKKSLIQKEKEVIIQALNDGKGMALGTIENQSLEQYYNQTFNTNEK
jgi:hypothetical protein